MTPGDPADSAETTALGQLVLLERQARDRGWWPLMRECYAPGSTVRLSWFRGSGQEFVAASERMAGRGDLSRHRLGPPVVHVRGPRAVIEVAASIEVRTELRGVEADLTSYARLVYRAERGGSRWRVTSLDPVYERDSLFPSVPGTSVPLDPADLAGPRPSYRLLAYVLGQRGYEVGDDLLGDDQPEAVRRFYRETMDWL